MHPMERLRMVARASGEEPGLLAREAAAALAGCAEDPRALVMACRRLVDRQAASGPLWWLAARVVASPDPGTEAWRSAEALRADATPSVVAASLPDDAVVAVLGWPEQVAEALRIRGDARVLVIDSMGDGSPLVAALHRAGSDAALVPESGIGAAVATSSLLLLDASAIGPGGFLAAVGSHARLRWPTPRRSRSGSSPAWGGSCLPAFGTPWSTRSLRLAIHGTATGRSSPWSWPRPSWAPAACGCPPRSLPLSTAPTRRS